MADYEEKIEGILDAMKSPGWRIDRDGGTSSEGVRPDRVYKRGTSIVIVEVEGNDSRKHFLGGATKAMRYYHESRNDGALLDL